ncbi:MAG: 4-hydroxyphenylacetate 3-hydroxylase family protein [Planctomycetota bacterium]|jgi:4-hydroxybutyryl-CoA dehydratase/vinylacetyl-CoA-Delta-isomerase|nr:4-hydroxyphenylacetate 3-hydroxylase family protein [Planctomycetota bacterium]MDP7131796.1 4-hydroxyphenylacetate 3-hydroxylase family protein [Planctomycetota bacterium]MDP7248194.1 4-hydroxyphenylacetate 3-hydroxylase family protein [Planctomycetota bacterium]
MLKTRDDYINSIRELNPVIYLNGERVESAVDHPVLKPHINAASMTYEVANDPECEELMTATSHITGKKINRFTHVSQSPEDLIKKVKMIRMLAHRTGSCFQRCVGMDALNALYTTTFDLDEEKGTPYHERCTEFLKHVQENDLMCVGAMTDPKGDRRLSPSQQADPDMFVHIVEERPDGIVVRGAKAHQTGSVNSHEIIVMPTMALKEEDKDYAVSFAVPADTPGVVLIFGRQSNDLRRAAGCSIDVGNQEFGVVGGEALMVLDNVFVPWERVFMCREYEFAGLLVERFATYHRQNYGGCKGGVGDIIAGASALIAEYHGTEKASHIRDKIVEMIHMVETLYGGSIACSCEAKETACGAYCPDPMLANSVKHNVTRFVYEIARLAHDIAGGAMATLPSEKDLENPETADYITKYYSAVADVPTEHRLRLLRLIENMTSATVLLESMHGAGSPQSQRVMFARQSNLDEKKELAKRLAGINDEDAK